MLNSTKHNLENSCLNTNKQNQINLHSKSMRNFPLTSIEALNILFLNQLDYKSLCGTLTLTKILSQKRKKCKEAGDKQKTNFAKFQPSITKKNNTSFVKDKKKEQVYTYNQLRIFLNNKPSPPWLQRLVAFTKYDKTLITGFPQCFNTGENVIISKNLFLLYQQILSKCSYKNLQRGVINFFERKGFRKLMNRDRKIMVFVKSDYKN
ncbi:hypothetical protein M0812_29525 [Anaeramoeba flamelloides]|uniref:Uncharacterized protein n=1 Tax=Anaeramoeba flamelloides TaxID=1746091 RepID=A0AAV7Y8P3_9EUKA|nr:hypothetical protein M0812_29525 [Anaeramoeba flamelloides]|eukprot:Anaeramoba_flamelloidesa1085_66.p1 GENE.a1085_66~~a1085_66.p1  ORF type:complete len:207 (+),score=32.06 a1085_66:70-690(+)